MKLISLALVSSLLCTVGNFLWKLHFSKRPFELASAVSWFETFLSWRVLLGGACYFSSMVLFFYLLSNYKMSVVAPLQSLTYLLNVGVAVLWFKERLSAGQAVGAALIMTGIFVLLRMSPSGAEAADAASTALRLEPNGEATAHVVRQPQIDRP
ncbi:EamA family transporter [Paenibacillus sp. TRM 82003]|nr:EamA family transporter [Paenibacillus sp. TRM 82003]